MSIDLEGVSRVFKVQSYVTADNIINYVAFSYR